MKPIYLEPDEEITSIIDRLSKTSETEIAVVVPKNSTMFQSLVNLKLLVRQAQKLGKKVAIISNNKVGSRLAKQLGLDPCAGLGMFAVSSQPVTEPAGPDSLPDGTPIHRYSPAVGLQEPNEKSSELGDVDEAVSLDTTKPNSSISTIPNESNQKPEAQINEPVASSQQPEAPVILPPIVSRQSQTSSGYVSSNTDNSAFAFPWKSALAAVAMLLVTLVVSYIFIPKATITLTFLSKSLNETFPLTVKTNLSPTEGVTLPESTTGAVVSGNLLTVERTATKEVTASGKKDIGTKASGTISIRNCEDTNSHLLPAGSKATANSKVFLTSTAVSIPPGQFSGGGTVCNSTSVTVTVTAQEAGEAHNLTTATFSLAGLPSRIAGSGSTTGGVTKQITVLSSDDVTNGYNDLKTQLNQDGNNELKSKAGDQVVLNDAIKSVIIEQKVDKEVGAQTDKAIVSLTLNLFTIVFDFAAIESSAKAKLATKLEINQQLITSNDKKPMVVFKDLTEDKTTLLVEVAATGFAAPKIDKDTVTKEVIHSSASDAERFLKDKYQANEVKIEIIPGWWPPRLPIISKAISVEYGFVEESSPSQQQ